MPTLDRAELDDLRLYLDLGRRLGMLHAQMDRGTVKQATLRYRGEVAAQEHQADHRQLRRRLDGGGARASQVNLVNAEVAGQGARDRDRSRRSRPTPATSAR